VAGAPRPVAGGRVGRVGGREALAGRHGIGGAAGGTLPIIHVLRQRNPTAFQSTHEPGAGLRVAASPRRDSADRADLRQRLARTHIIADRASRRSGRRRVGLGVIVSLASASRRRRTAGPVLAGSGAATRPELLDLRIDRPEQLRRWMSEDPDLTRLVDSTIGRQVLASEARQCEFSAGVGVASLIAGWLLSAFNPLSLFR
jgi:hypothetical protein